MAERCCNADCHLSWVSHINPLCWVSLYWKSLCWVSWRRYNRSWQNDSCGNGAMTFHHDNVIFCTRQDVIRTNAAAPVLLWAHLEAEESRELIVEGSLEHEVVGTGTQLGYVIQPFILVSSEGTLTEREGSVRLTSLH